ncbi:MAG: hypothetical protein DWQ47_09245 [Acidobacteria bacterium]|nr:MAG: hypothetical protein DWQ32_17345 [Acidobacteriota bacterium]REJ98913.1 MAG: hypothetical protein DWQ38_12635 [Acidobacteriota bacterium]REK16368.1 MAG: hypothetical protein DWQ43_05055 [Acidobacteriota bacterium]REK44049.1 MAG: hypothetical protein DWQ47_09245 [Acidobacteriota bacterium]
MKLILAVFVCLLAAAPALGQTNGERPEEGPVLKIALAKEEKDGTITEDPPSFEPTDIPIICYIDLREETPATVKLTIVAVKAVGLRPNTGIVTVAYRTKAGENQVTFQVQPSKTWALGEYRADVFVDGKKSGERSFSVTKK